MNFTFGIITSGEYGAYIEKIIKSIENENIPNYEIIIVGGNNIHIHDKVRHIPFDESIKMLWISRKKNIITENAIYENIVYMHDYIELMPGWYEGHLKFGEEFEVLMDKMTNPDGSRYRDWVLWNAPFINNGRHLIPYDITHLSKYMYISGAYWVSKKWFMLENPIDETRGWNQGEDVDWSHRVRDKVDFKMNINSTVRLLKTKDPVFKCYSQEDYDKLKVLPPPSVELQNEMRRGFYGNKG